MPAFTLVPKADYKIDWESWRPVGLAGTGSFDVIVENAFVPDHNLRRRGRPVPATWPSTAARARCGRDQPPYQPQLRRCHVDERSVRPSACRWKGNTELLSSGIASLDHGMSYFGGKADFTKFVYWSSGNSLFSLQKFPVPSIGNSGGKPRNHWDSEPSAARNCPKIRKIPCSFPC